MRAGGKGCLFFAIVWLCLWSQVAPAADSDSLAEFNEAWNAYESAVASQDQSQIVAAAEAAVAAGRKAFADDDERLPVLLTNYGTALSAKGRETEAKEVLHEALRLAESIHGDDAIELVDIIEPLGDCYAYTGFSKEQLNYYRRSLDIIARHFGPKSPELAQAHVRAANSAYTLSRSTAGFSHLRKAREIYISLFGEDSLQVGNVDYHFAKFNFSMKRYGKAVELALEALTKLNGDSEKHLRLQLYTRALLVQAYEERGMSKEATPHIVEIGRISESRPDQQPEPIFRIGPTYPMAMIGASGRVDIEFTIDEFGFVRDPRVVDSARTGEPMIDRERSKGLRSADRTFEAAALDAISRWRFAPVFVDGTAKPVKAATTIVFEMAE